MLFRSKLWEPSMPPQCITFDSCNFWVQIHGLPIEGTTEEAIREIAENIGVVSEVRIATKGYASIVVGRARVLLRSSTPLSSYMLFSFKGKEHWLDFKYERLPHFCYSCGIIGYYAKNCELMSYDEELTSINEKMFHGP